MAACAARCSRGYSRRSAAGRRGASLTGALAAGLAAAATRTHTPRQAP